MLDIHLEEKKEQRQPPRTSIQSGSLDQRKAPVRGFSRSTSLNRLLAITGDYQIANPLLSVKGETEYLQDAELFEKDYVQNVRERPYRSTAKRWLINGGGIGAILLLPFGPIGLLAGFVMGSLCGICCGLLSDLITLKKKQGEAEKQKTKIGHLMRWAEFHFSSSEDQLQLLFKVIVEYQALAAVGAFSQTARSQLRMLYKFLKRDDVQHVLSTYLDHFFSHWRKMGVEEISMCNTVFEVCIQCCNHLRKKRPAVVQKMEEILSQYPAVIRLFAQAETLQRKQRERAVRDRDWLMYADAGEITAQEVFRKDMAVAKASFILPTQIPGDDTTEEQSISTQLEKREGETEEEEEEEMPERDPNVTEIVVSEEEEEGEEEEESKDVETFEEEASTLLRLSSIEQIGLQRYFTSSEATESTSPPSGASVTGPLTPIPVHVAIARQKDVVPEERTSRIALPLRFSADELPTKRPTRRLEEGDFISVAVQPLRKRKSSKISEDKAVLAHKKSEDAVPTTAREKRLFRSLTDLINFDVQLKHQTPIGCYELEYLARLEIHDSASKEWDCVVNKPQCQVYKLKGDSPVVLVKAYAHFEGVPMAVLSHFIRHIPTRSSWDKTFEDYRLIEKDVEGNEMIYCSMKAPWPIANRDFLQWRRTRIAESGDVIIIMRSASHPEFPEKPGVVRAETIISGYIVRQHDKNPNVSKLFLVAQTDVRGLIPKFAVNQGAQRAPIQWTDALKKACTEYVKRHGSSPPDYDAIKPAI